MKRIDRAAAASLMGISESYFRQKYSAMFTHCGLGKNKMYSKKEVEKVRDELIKNKTHEKDKKNRRNQRL